MSNCAIRLCCLALISTISHQPSAITLTDNYFHCLLVHGVLCRRDVSSLLSQQILWQFSTSAVLNTKVIVYIKCYMHHVTCMKFMYTHTHTQRDNVSCCNLCLLEVYKLLQIYCIYSVIILIIRIFAKVFKVRNN